MSAPVRVVGVVRVAEGWRRACSGPRAYAQELEALRVVAPPLAAAGFRVPTLVSAASDALELVTTHVPGAPVPRPVPALHAQAGAFLAALHALPCPDHDPVPLAEALDRRATSWLAKARDHVPADVLADARAAVDPARFVGARRTWCHRDFGPHNWVEDAGVLGVVDFEHARPDHPLVDLLKLADGDWLDAPATRVAFEASYGALDPDDEARLRILAWLHAVATLAWAGARGDRTWAARGERLIRHLRASGGAGP